MLTYFKISKLLCIKPVSPLGFFNIFMAIAKSLGPPLSIAIALVFCGQGQGRRAEYEGTSQVQYFDLHTSYQSY